MKGQYYTTPPIFRYSSFRSKDLIRHETKRCIFIWAELSQRAVKSVAIFHEVRRNYYSITPIFVENIRTFRKLKIIGLDQTP